MNEFVTADDIVNKIKSLTKIYEESNRTILYLNKIVDERVNAKNVEITKNKSLKQNIKRLKTKLSKLEKLE